MLFTAFFLQLLLGMSAACSYEHIGRRHTMCIYRERACPNSQLIRSGSISAQDKNLILKIHNQLRSKLALGKVRGLPPAANMRVMTWDNELAMIAQRWADQCTYGHDELRKTERGSVGQNVAIFWSHGYRDPLLGDKPDWSSSISLWAKEYDQFGFHSGHISPFVYKKDIGHYTQMAWGDTHKIGCGFSYYKDPQRGYTKLYVCNYFPAGNVVQGTMYKISPRGATCTDPSLELSKEHKGLCADKRNHSRTSRNNPRQRRQLWHSRHENSRIFRLNKRNVDKTKRKHSCTCISTL